MRTQNHEPREERSRRGVATRHVRVYRPALGSDRVPRGGLSLCAGGGCTSTEKGSEWDQHQAFRKRATAYSVESLQKAFVLDFSDGADNIKDTWSLFKIRTIKDYETFPEDAMRFWMNIW